MTVVLIEGFDTWELGYTSHAEKGWIGEFAFVETGRFGGRAASIVNPMMKVLPSSYSTLVFGVAMNVAVGGKNRSISLGTGSGPGLSITWGDDMRVQLRDSTGALVGSGGSQIITTRTWHYYEVKVTAGGTAELRLDGAEEIAAVSGNWGASFDRVTLETSWPLPYDLFYDDLYICDTTGSVNDFLGDVTVTTLHPAADATYHEWTPDSGTVHWTRVDEELSDGDASYVKAGSADLRELYRMQNRVPPFATVYGVQLNLRMRKNDAGTHAIQPMVRHDGVDYLGPLQSVASSYDVRSWLLTQDPSDVDWTPVTLDAAEYGVKLIS